MKTSISASLLAAAVSLTAFSAAAYTTSYYAPHSFLSSGHVVKIQVDTTGIYEISHQQLRDLGFSDPEKVAVYGYGGVACTDHTFVSSYPDDLPQTATMHTQDGRLLFYGEGPARAYCYSKDTILTMRNYYDNNAYYFLSDKGGVSTVNTTLYDPSSSAEEVKWSMCIDMQTHHVQNPGEGSVFYHGPRLKPGEGMAFPFSIRDFYDNGSAGLFQYEGACLSSSQYRFPIDIQGNINITSNSPSLSVATTKGTVIYKTISGVARYTSTEDKPLQSTTPVTFTVSVPSDFNGTYSAITQAYLYYPQLNNLAGRPFLMMNFISNKSHQPFCVAGASDETEIWNVTNPTAIYRYEKVFDGQTGIAHCSFTNATTNKGIRLLAFNPSDTHRSPVVVGEVAHQSIHSMSVPDMLIVTNETCRAAAEELAQLHRERQGFDVLVVTQNQCFNEFSSGARHPGAIRRAAKMFYDRDKTKLRYLLLYGDATWDNRGIVYPNEDYLVTFECENSSMAQENTTNYAADLYFGMLGDGYAHATIYAMPTQISVGRIPAASHGEATAVNAKIRAFFDNPPSVRDYMRGVFLSCPGDNYQHLAQSNEAANQFLKNSDAFTVIRADNLLYEGSRTQAGKYPQVTTLVEQALNAGVGYFTYSGHGNDREFNGDDTYDFHCVEKYRYSSIPFAMLATCHTYPFDHNTANLTEKMLFTKGGGAIGILASTRSVYLEHNRTLNTYVAKAYAEATDGLCYGDLFTIARNRIISDGMMVSSLGNNCMAYNYCGDPAVPINAPTLSVKIDRINGAPAGDAGSVTAEAYAPVTIVAHVEDAAGNEISTFNGVATVDVYDTPIRLPYMPQDEDPFTIYHDDSRIASVVAKVVNGRIEHTFEVGNPNAEGGPNRIVIIADEEHGATAVGGTKALAIAVGTPSEDVADTAPAVEEMYLNGPDFVNGASVLPTATLYAVVDPSPSGLEASNFGVANTSVLTIDGISMPNAIKAMRLGADGKMHLEVPLSNLAYGRHEISLKAVNRVGLSHTANIDFAVLPGDVTAALTLENPDAPARTQAVLDIASADTELEVTRLLVSDSRGNTVFSTSAVSMPYIWDLTDSKGQPVADGLYQAHAIFRTPNSKGSTPQIDIIVVK